MDLSYPFYSVLTIFSLLWSISPKMGQIGGLLGLRLTQGGPPVAPRGAQHPFLCLPQLQFSAVAQKEIWPFFETTHRRIII